MLTASKPLIYLRFLKSYNYTPTIKKPVTSTVTGFLLFSEMLLRGPDTPTTPLTLSILPVLEVKTDETDEVFRRGGNAALPVFDASFRYPEQLSEGAAVLRPYRACASHRLRQWS